jgi:hypothetical protein
MLRVLLAFFLLYSRPFQYFFLTGQHSISAFVESSLDAVRTIPYLSSEDIEVDIRRNISEKIEEDNFILDVGFKDINMKVVLIMQLFDQEGNELCSGTIETDAYQKVLCIFPTPTSLKAGAIWYHLHFYTTDYSRALLIHPIYFFNNDSRPPATRFGELFIENIPEIVTVVGIGGAAALGYHLYNHYCQDFKSKFLPFLDPHQIPTTPTIPPPSASPLVSTIAEASIPSTHSLSSLSTVVPTTPAVSSISSQLYAAAIRMSVWPNDLAEEATEEEEKDNFIGENLLQTKTLSQVQEEQHDDEEDEDEDVLEAFIPSPADSSLSFTSPTVYQYSPQIIVKEYKPISSKWYEEIPVFTPPPAKKFVESVILLIRKQPTIISKKTISPSVSELASSSRTSSMTDFEIEPISSTISPFESMQTDSQLESEPILPIESIPTSDSWDPVETDNQEDIENENEIDIDIIASRIKITEIFNQENFDEDLFLRKQQPQQQKQMSTNVITITRKPLSIIRSIVRFPINTFKTIISKTKENFPQLFNRIVLTMVSILVLSQIPKNANRPSQSFPAVGKKKREENRKEMIEVPSITSSLMLPKETALENQKKKDEKKNKVGKLQPSPRLPEETTFEDISLLENKNKKDEKIEKVEKIQSPSLSLPKETVLKSVSVAKKIKDEERKEVASSPLPKSESNSLGIKKKIDQKRTQVEELHSASLPLPKETALEGFSLNKNKKREEASSLLPMATSIEGYSLEKKKIKDEKRSEFPILPLPLPKKATIFDSFPFAKKNGDKKRKESQEVTASSIPRPKASSLEDIYLGNTNKRDEKRKEAEAVPSSSSSSSIPLPKAAVLDGFPFGKNEKDAKRKEVDQSFSLPLPKATLLDGFPFAKNRNDEKRKDVETSSPLPLPIATLFEDSATMMTSSHKNQKHIKILTIPAKDKSPLIPFDSVNLMAVEDYSSPAPVIGSKSGKESKKDVVGPFSSISSSNSDPTHKKSESKNQFWTQPKYFRNRNLKKETEKLNNPTNNLLLSSKQAPDDISQTILENPKQGISFSNQATSLLSMLNKFQLRKNDDDKRKNNVLNNQPAPAATPSVEVATSLKKSNSKTEEVPILSFNEMPFKEKPHISTSSPIQIMLRQWENDDNDMLVYMYNNPEGKPSYFGTPKLAKLSAVISYVRDLIGKRHVFWRSFLLLSCQIFMILIQKFRTQSKRSNADNSL